MVSSWSVHALVAGFVVTLASVLTVAVIRALYRNEVRHAASRRLLLILFMWFVVTYGFMAFVIDPVL